MGFWRVLGRTLLADLRRENGQAFVLEAMLIVAFIAVLAVVVDGGKFMVEKRQAQNAVDAAALAAAAHATYDANGLLQCETGSDCWNAVADYLGKNGYFGPNGGPIPECGTTTPCFTVTAPYPEPAGNMVQVVLHTGETPIFAGLVGTTFPFVTRAAATVGAQTQTTTTPGATYTTTTTFVGPGAPASIFVRGNFCQSFFFPGSGNHVSGVVTNGGVGNFPAGNVVDAIQMNHYWYNDHNCNYPTVAGAPHPPSFWQYDANGNPLDGAGPDEWVVGFPDLGAILRSPDPAVHCLYSKHNIVGKQISSGTATLTTDGTHCLRVGDSVTLSLSDKRLTSGTVTVTGATATTFSYATSVSTFFRTVTKKALTAGVATLTLSGNNPVLYPGDVIDVSGVDSTFNCTHCTVTAAGSSSVSYAVPGAPNVTAVASGGRVDFTGDVAQTAATGTETRGAIPSITSSSWKTTNPPGIYVLDAPYGTSLTIGTSGTSFAGYTWVAPEILLSGAGNTFSNYSGAPLNAVFFAYNPNGDAVHENEGSTSYITGSIFCGPPEPTAANPDPTNKCWFGGDNTTFTGLMEAWHIEWKLDGGDFNGTGPPVGTTTGTTVFTISTPASTQTTTVGVTVGGLGE